MKLSYTGNNQNLRNAVIFVNSLDNNIEFWNEVRDKGRFDFSDWSGQRVELVLATNYPTVKVVLHKFKDSRTNAATDPLNEWKIYYSQDKLGRSVSAMVSTLVHEFVHNVDWFGDGSTHKEMGHGDQSPEGKANSVPWWVGALAGRYYRDLVSSSEKMDDEPFHEEFEIDPAGNIEEPETPLGERVEDLRLEKQFRAEAG